MVGSVPLGYATQTYQSFAGGGEHHSAASLSHRRSHHQITDKRRSTIDGETNRCIALLGLAAASTTAVGSVWAVPT